MTEPYYADGPCAICGTKNAERICVHAECIVHRHDTVGGPPIIRRQEEWSALWGRADGAEEHVADLEASLERVTTALHRVSAHFMDGYPIEGLEDHAAEAVRNVDEVLHGPAVVGRGGTT